MPEMPTPQQLERYRREALEFAQRSVLPNINQETLIPQGETVNPIQPVPPAANFEEFLQQHPSSGNLKVQISAANGTFPVPGATVEVFLDLQDGRRTLYRNTTDQSGIVDNMELPARPVGFSQSEATASGSGTQYSFNIYHPAFNPIENGRVIIFDRVETILPITLQPKIPTERMI